MTSHYGFQITEDDSYHEGDMVIGGTSNPGAPKVIVGWQAPNRGVLITQFGFASGPFLRIVLPCGNVREYLTKKDVPARSIQCNCGEIDPEHWFIRYTEVSQRPTTEVQ